MKIAIGLIGTQRKQNCIQDLKKYILDPNESHEIHVYAYVWDIKGDREKYTGTDYDVYTDSPILFVDGIFRCSMDLADNSFKDELETLKCKIVYKVFNYKEYLKHEKIPSNLNWSKIHRKTQYMYNKPKHYLNMKLMNDLDDSYDMVFITRCDKLVTKDAFFKELKFIDNNTYTYGGKLNTDTSEHNASLKYTKQIFDITDIGKSYNITTFLRDTGTCGFEWAFGDYKSMFKLCSLYTCYDYVIYLLTKTQNVLSDELIRTVHSVINNINVNGLIDEELHSYEDTIQKYMNQEFNVRNCALMSHIPEELL